MRVRTQEAHLAEALLLEFVAIVHRVERVDCRIDTAQTVIETYPHVVDIPVGSEDALRDLQLVEDVTVILGDTTFIGIVRAHVIVPH